MLQSICFPGFSTLKVPKLIRQLPLVCNFPGHPPSLVHRGSADPGETGLFFQSLQTGFRSCLKQSWSLRLMSYMAGVGKEHPSVLSPTPLTLLTDLYPSCQPSSCPLRRTRRARLSPPLHHLPSQERGNCFSLLPIPSCTNLEGTFWKQGDCLQTLVSSSGKWGGFCGLPEARDSICKMSFPMKWHSKVGFHLSSCPHHLLWFKVWNGFTGSPEAGFARLGSLCSPCHPGMRKQPDTTYPFLDYNGIVIPAPRE